MKKSNIALFRIGNHYLYREQNLIECEIPILFVCIDDVDNRYLVLNLDFEMDEYLVAKVTKTDLTDMLESKITIRKPFENSESIYLIRAGESLEKDIIVKKDFSDINEEDLPRENLHFIIN
jgi:hypothetical protein